MPVKTLAMAALCAALAPPAEAALLTTVVAPEPPAAVLQAIVNVGTTSSCGLREAPHLIEHLLLSDTQYGDNPVDAVVSLRAQGIKLTALTRSDYTQFTLEGPPEKADLMGRALATFLGRSLLPISGFEREQRAILHELRAPESYVSTPTFYERFIAVTAGGVEPCAADMKAFVDYRFDEVQSAYDQLYTAANFKLVAKSNPGTFDLSAISAGILHGHSGTPVNSQPGVREDGKSIRVIGNNHEVEIIFPIAGRQSLPEDAAYAYADQARLELQAYIRQKFQLYTARSFVDQSIRGGWIRFEIPDVAPEQTQDLVAIAQAAMGKIRPTEYNNDVVWQSYGSQRDASPVRAPMVAQVQENAGKTAFAPIQSLIDSWMN